MPPFFLDREYFYIPSNETDSMRQKRSWVRDAASLVKLSAIWKVRVEQENALSTDGQCIWVMEYQRLTMATS